MKRLQIRLIVLLTVSLFVLVPLAHGQEEVGGYTELWRQWRLSEIQYYPAAALADESASPASDPAQAEALGYADLWRQWRMQEIQTYAQA